MSHKPDQDLILKSTQIAMRTSVISIIVNIVLSIGKLIAGLVASSNAMISDAIHSASDVFSTIILMIGIQVAKKEPDEEHPYGHERFECIAAVILADILFLTGGGIGYSGIKSLLMGQSSEIVIPGMLALWAALVSILVKEGMYQYTRYQGKKINSTALMADAWHHRSDALSSIGALIGIFLAMKGYPFMDCIASIIICLFIIKAAWDIFMDAMNKMVDHSCEPAFNEELSSTISSMEGVESLDSLLTRTFGNRVYVDVEIGVNGNLTLTEAHNIAENVHYHLEHNYPIIKHATVHVNPS